jgi:hypothetical protein
VTRRKTGPFNSDGHSMHITHTRRPRRRRGRRPPDKSSKVVTTRLDPSPAVKCVDCPTMIFPTMRRNKSTGTAFNICRCGPCWQTHMGIRRHHYTAPPNEHQTS